MIQQGPTIPINRDRWAICGPIPIAIGRRAAFRPHTASLRLAVLYFNTCIVEALCLGSKFPASRPRLMLLEAPNLILLPCTGIDFLHLGAFKSRASNKISREPRWVANSLDARRRPEAI